MVLRNKIYLRRIHTILNALDARFKKNILFNHEFFKYLNNFISFKKKVVKLEIFILSLKILISMHQNLKINFSCRSSDCAENL